MCCWDKKDEMTNESNDRIVVAITGASGPILGIRLIEELVNAQNPVTAIVSQEAWKVIRHEILQGETRQISFLELLEERNVIRHPELLRATSDADTEAPEASGTTPFSAVVIIPCSMKTLSAVAHGYAVGLITRAADVALKERRRLILVPRETPLNRIHVDNMQKAMQAGAEIVPPIPAFYVDARTIDDVVDFVVGKILNLLGRPHRLFAGWEGDLT